MYNLKVSVERIEGFCDLPMKVGDYFEVKGSAIYIPPGGKICLWALQSLLPFLPAKQRNHPPNENDWLPKTKRLTCPDPNGKVIFRVDLINPKTGEILSDDSDNEKKFRIIVDESKCIDCKACESVCRKSHNGISGIRVIESKVNVCRQCGIAPCIEACEFNALSKNEFGAIVIDKQKCTLCGKCANVCPFNAIFISNTEIFICNLCEDNPACVTVCPTSAIKFEDLTEKV